MEKKIFNALSDEALDQVAGGSSEKYNRQTTINGQIIDSPSTLLAFCNALKNESEQNRIMILETCKEYSLVDAYLAGGVMEVYVFLHCELAF